MSQFSAAFKQAYGTTPAGTEKCLKPQSGVRFDSDNSLTFCYNARRFQVFKGVTPMKQHRFWAWAAVICMIMVMLTGYKRK